MTCPKVIPKLWGEARSFSKAKTAPSSDLITISSPLTSPQALSPLEDIEDADGQVAEGEDQQHHHQHLGCLPSSAHLLHLRQEGPGPRLGLCAQASPRLLRLV